MSISHLLWKLTCLQNVTTLNLGHSAWDRSEFFSLIFYSNLMWKKANSCPFINFIFTYISVNSCFEICRGKLSFGEISKENNSDIFLWFPKSYCSFVAEAKLFTFTYIFILCLLHSCWFLNAFIATLSILIIRSLFTNLKHISCLSVAYESAENVKKVEKLEIMNRCVF